MAELIPLRSLKTNHPSGMVENHKITINIRYVQLSTTRNGIITHKSKTSMGTMLDMNGNNLHGNNMGY